MKVITFSRFYPHKHPKAGHETFFIERIWKGLETGNFRDGEYTIHSVVPRMMKDGHWQLPHLWRDQMTDNNFRSKFHTIRAGNRWKIGDSFSPRIWSGKPYRSKQIQFAPAIEIKKLWDFEIKPDGSFYINGMPMGGSTGHQLSPLKKLAQNDGFENTDDFECWFPGDRFKGQIICWNDKIKY